jgi:hypothetical protein
MNILQSLSFFHRSWSGIFLLAWFCIIASPSHQATAGELHYINIAAFQIPADGVTDAIFTGPDYALMKNMSEKKGRLLFMLRTSPVKDKDVVNFQSDVLHLTKSGTLGNGGLDCQFSFDNESDEDSQFYSLSGICTAMTSHATGTNKQRIMMKRVTLADIMPTTQVWTRLYKDEASNIVFYADMD